MFLSGLSGLITVDGANEIWAMPIDTAFRLSITPPASAPLQIAAVMLALNDSDLFNGAVGIIEESNKIIFDGKASHDWQHVGDFRDAILRIVYQHIPYSTYDFQADVSPLVINDGDGTALPRHSRRAVSEDGSTAIAAQPGFRLPEKIFGVDSKLLIVGGLAVLIFMGSQK